MPVNAREMVFYAGASEMPVSRVTTKRCSLQIISITLCTHANRRCMTAANTLDAKFFEFIEMVAAFHSAWPHPIKTRKRILTDVLLFSFGKIARC